MQNEMQEKRASLLGAICGLVIYALMLFYIISLI